MVLVAHSNAMNAKVVAVRDSMITVAISMIEAKTAAVAVDTDRMIADLAAAVVSISAMMKAVEVAIKASGPVAVVIEVVVDLAVITMIDSAAVNFEETVKLFESNEVSVAIGKWAVAGSVAAMNEAIVAVIAVDRAAASETTTAIIDVKEAVTSVISVTSRTNKAVAAGSITEAADTIIAHNNNNRAVSVEIVTRIDRVVSAVEAEMTEALAEAASEIREASVEAHPLD